MLNPNIQRITAARQSGFSLLEILVTIIIVAVGSLGIAGTIITGMQASSSSAERNIAAQQISSLIEMMGTNPSMKYHGIAPNYSAYVTPWSGVFSPVVCPAAGCDTVGQSRNQLSAFRDNVRAALPGGEMRVKVIGNNPPMLAISVAWYEQSAANRAHINANLSAAQKLAATSGCDQTELPPNGLNQCLTVTIPAK
jgi:type IV pilus assembly protein PilV